MKLTNAIRDGIIAAIMQDVPKVDYGEEARKLVQQFCVDHLPAKLNPLYAANKDYFHHETLWGLPGPLPNVTVVGRDSGQALLKAMENDGVFWPVIVSLANRLATQNMKHKELKAKIHDALYSCNTTKQAIDLLPDFEKYIPTDEAPNRALPAVVNPIADFRAAGFPKDKKPIRRLE